MRRRAGLLAQVVAVARVVAVALVAFGLAGSPSLTAGHDFEESRRLVLALHGERLELLVSYELRPGRLADGLRARFDAGADGRVATAWERLARSRVMAPRLVGDLRVEAESGPIDLTLVELAFPSAPREGGRLGVAAVARYEAALPPRATELQVSGGRGRATLEAQAAPPLRLESDGLAARAGDPVLGPAVLRPGRPVRLRLR